MILKFFKKIFSNESPYKVSIHNKNNAIENTELKENENATKLNSEVINKKNNNQTVTTKCLNPNSIFPLNIYGNFDDDIINRLLKTLNQTNEFGGVIASQVTKLFFETSILCKEVDAFHITQKYRLEKIRNQKKDLNELFTPCMVNIEEMIHFIKNYDLSKVISHSSYDLSYDMIEFYLNYTKQWNKIVTINPGVVEKELLDILFTKDILLQATQSPVDVRLQTLKMTDLRDICKEHDIKAKRKKIDIIDQLKQINNISEIVNNKNNFNNQLFINHPENIINDYENIFDYFKVIQFVGRIFTFTYIDSKRSMNDYNNFITAGYKTFRIYSDRCNCSSSLKGNGHILVKKNNFPPYELGCDCTARPNF